MRIEIKRDSIIIIPDNDVDIAFIEDSLGITKNGQKVEIERVNDVSLGFHNESKFVLKLTKEHGAS